MEIQILKLKALIFNDKPLFLFNNVKYYYMKLWTYILLV